MAVVNLLKSHASLDPLLMHILRCLAFYIAFYSFHIPAEHIPGILNTAMDALSRNNLSLFHSLVPQSQQVSPTQAVMDLVVNSRPDWGSQVWTHLFVCSLTRDYPQQPRQSTDQDGVSTSQLNIMPLPLVDHSQTAFAAYYPNLLTQKLYAPICVPLAVADLGFGKGRFLL